MQVGGAGVGFWVKWDDVDAGFGWDYVTYMLHTRRMFVFGYDEDSRKRTPVWRNGVEGLGDARRHDGMVWMLD